MKRCGLMAMLALALVAPMQAWGECAWVLWVEVTNNSKTQPWQPVDASSTEGQCRSKMAQRIRRQADMHRPTALPAGVRPLEPQPHVVIVVGDDRKAIIYAFQGPDELRAATDEIKAQFEGKAENSVVVFKGHDFLSENYKCLPDTINPRGPKR